MTIPFIAIWMANNSPCHLRAFEVAGSLGSELQPFSLDQGGKNARCLSNFENNFCG